jgi:uncharacterized membrane protein
MNKTLKWILIGLGIALVVFFIAMSVFYMLRVAGGVGGTSWRGMMPFQGMMPYRSGYHMPFLGFMPMMGFGFFRLLLPLAVIGFAVYGLVRLAGGKSKRYDASASQTPPPLTGETQRACVACGKALPGEGEYCPHCGAKQ